MSNQPSLKARSKGTSEISAKRNRRSRYFGTFLLRSAPSAIKNAKIGNAILPTPRRKFISSPRKTQA